MRPWRAWKGQTLLLRLWTTLLILALSAFVVVGCGEEGPSEGGGGSNGAGGAAGMPGAGGSGGGGAGGIRTCERPEECDDDNDCTEDVCDPVDLICANTTLTDGTTCAMNGDPGECVAGTCRGLCELVDCSDGNPCTDDVCSMVDGTCSNEVSVDGTMCEIDTYPGQCADGLCVGLCEDVDCDDDNECTEDVCERADGSCLNPNRPDGAECDFGSLPLPGRCASGVCEDAKLCRDVDCSDGNDCTDDVCDAADGSCSNPNKVDGAVCEIGGNPGRCSAGRCTGLCEAVDCSDDNQCTMDTCDPANGSCPNPPEADGTSCDLGGEPGRCSDGLCVGLCSGIDCDDRNECTNDACDPAVGMCIHSPAADGVACDLNGRPGVCSTGVCVSVCDLGLCDDGNECTSDICFVSDGSCANNPVSDNTACDFGGLPGRCLSGTCRSICQGVECEDNNECTLDTCNLMTGKCVHAPVTDNTACDFDGLPGVCKSGVCEDAMLCEAVDCDDDNECTTDACNPQTGNCVYTPVTDNTACDFNGLPGQCKAGVCQGLCQGVDCDDTNECTTDACNPQNGQCTHTPVGNGTPCDLGGAPGVCQAGTCVPQPAPVEDDD